MDFVKTDESANKLVITAANLNGGATDIEDIIITLYGDNFKNKKHLHELIEQNKEELSELTKIEITNLGLYIGRYTIENKEIIPILIGNAIDQLPKKIITEPLENMLIRLLKKQYGPKFTKKPETTIRDIEEKTKSYKRNAKTIFNKLQQHYNAILEMREELK
jgi:hypothetical protein